MNLRGGQKARALWHRGFLGSETVRSRSAEGERRTAMSWEAAQTPKCCDLFLPLPHIPSVLLGGC